MSGLTIIISNILRNIGYCSYLVIWLVSTKASARGGAFFFFQYLFVRFSIAIAKIWFVMNILYDPYTLRKPYWKVRSNNLLSKKCSHLNLIKRSNVFVMHDINAIGRYDEGRSGFFCGFSMGQIIIFLNFSVYSCFIHQLLKIVKSASLAMGGKLYRIL